MPYSKKDADRALNFIEGMLKHTADDWYGKPFILAPWQRDAVRQIYGQRDEKGHRLIETVYLEVPKKSGKTEFAAALLLMEIALAPNPGFQAYGEAAATRQAMNVFNAAKSMVQQSKFLSQIFAIRESAPCRISKITDTNTFYAAVAADGDLGDGVNPGCFVADEVHRWRVRKQLENWDVMAAGGITRKQRPLIVAITTAGVRADSPLAWRLHETTINTNDRKVDNPRFYGRIYAADPTDDIADPETWLKANPSLEPTGCFLTPYKDAQFSRV